jgi:molecular chaperone DnaK (HSP70)
MKIGIDLGTTNSALAYIDEREADDRQKVERDPASPILIHSVRGFGYTFEPRRVAAA